jgi:protein involved in polysaccharide export with SLBB domain
MIDRPFKLLSTALVLASAIVSAGADSSATNGVTAPTEISVPGTNVPASIAYHLHPNDMIEVHIYGEDELTSKVKLSESGTIVLPLLPALELAGQTVAQARDRVRDAYMKDFLINPVVTVAIVEYGNSKLSVLGQVRSPGVYQFPSNERLNLLQAIALAGGYTRIGQPSKITVKRLVNGAVSIIRLDAKAMAEKEKTTIFEISPSDVITVGETVF